ncbi:TetR family transcriptional regulator C-terminal domain-containing protein [Paracoccaceae bacterium GXU_MW_L88]
MDKARRLTRIQKRNREAILTAALEVFAAHGFRGATVDEIATLAGLSKANLLYYFRSKEEIHRTLLDAQIEEWLAPLQAISEDGEPLEELLAYMRCKLDMSRTHAKQSRLFANAVVRGAEHIEAILSGRLKAVVDEKAALIERWMDEGRIAKSDPYHLIFSFWAITQHYADFEVQIHAVLGPDHDPITEARPFAETLYRRLLTP